MRFSPVTTQEELSSLIREIGFLPFFRNHIPGFSIEEITPADLWFSDERDGPWEWKGPVITMAHCAYGKLFQNKAGYISEEWFPDFANYRRDGYDFEARYEDGLAKHKDKLVMDVLEETGPILSKSLKQQAGFGKDGQKGFDGVITRLQMQGYVLCTNFEYMRDKHGIPYGWGVARYGTPEQFFGERFADLAYQRDPAESYSRMLEHLKKILPDADDTSLRKLLG